MERTNDRTLVIEAETVMTLAVIVRFSARMRDKVAAIVEDADRIRWSTRTRVAVKLEVADRTPATTRENDADSVPVVVNDRLTAFDFASVADIALDADFTSLTTRTREADHAAEADLTNCTVRTRLAPIATDAVRACVNVVRNDCQYGTGSPRKICHGFRQNEMHYTSAHSRPETPIM